MSIHYTAFGVKKAMVLESKRGRVASRPTPRSSAISVICRREHFNTSLSYATPNAPGIMKCQSLEVLKCRRSVVCRAVHPRYSQQLLGAFFPAVLTNVPSNSLLARKMVPSLRPYSFASTSTSSAASASLPPGVSPSATRRRSQCGSAPCRPAVRLHTGSRARPWYTKHTPGAGA